jgi:predicted nucleic acid-binding protein
LSGKTISSNNFIVVYDACVLYPFNVRDILIELATTGLFKARWTTQINEEWTRNLLKNEAKATPEALNNVVRLMESAVRDCLVEDYQEIIPSLETLPLPDPGDAHVVAAAIKAKAVLIVTFNLKDFPQEVLARYGIEAIHPDDFICDVIDLDPVRVLNAVRDTWRMLRKPPRTWPEHLACLEHVGLKQSAERLALLAEVEG